MARRSQIVVKFSDEVALPTALSRHPILEWHEREWAALLAELPGRLVATPLFGSVSRVELDTLVRVAKIRSEQAHEDYRPPKFENYLWLNYESLAHPDMEPNERDAHHDKAAEFIVESISKWADVAHCYERLEDETPALKRASAPITFAAPNTDPEHPLQAHLQSAPAGLGAKAMWQYEGANGAGQHFVDIERGWNLAHKDLLNAAGQPRVTQDRRNGGVRSRKAADVAHGTSVLGIVCASHNAINTIGLVPALESMQVLSYISGTGDTSTADTIMRAAANQIANSIDERRVSMSVRPTTVILIEAHARLRNSSFYFPVEIYPETFAAIELATQAGITVIEPAGNGRVPGSRDEPLDRFSVDLDEIQSYVGRATGAKAQLRSLNPSTERRPETRPERGAALTQLAPYRDSGAIIVGAATYIASGRGKWTRLLESNYGTRVDCFAAGERVITLNDRGGNATEFSGTSSASAIIAGAALMLQGIAQANRGAPLAPRKLRAALKDVASGTPSVTPSTDKIGVMPNLPKVAEKYAAAP
ncbi:MAG: hypothetical protein EAZ30_00795 [Betaproteobacteria bacterium]|nr:MAG: hypothetical protein EAZ30_00795 [Betaproteobacteria bacterium]